MNNISSFSKPASLSSFNAYLYGMRFALLTAFLILLVPVGAKAQTPIRIVALGDSLTAGYGVQPHESFASKLEAALKAEGYDVRVDNAGVSGNTAEQGLARLEQSIAGEPAPRLVIIELGANDMLRRIDPAIPRKHLATILTRLKERKIPVLLTGIHKLSSNFVLFSDPYKAMYKDLADEYDVPLYPFFLKGVAMNGQLNLPDGIHPNAKGIDVVVENILPSVKKALKD